MSAAEDTTTTKTLMRGFFNKCPRCGNGKLLSGYITPLEDCASCALPYAPLRADDGPAWLTIFITGHLMVPFIYWVIESGIESTLVIMSILLPLILFFCGLILPRAKGLFMAIIWLTRVKKTPAENNSTN